jgi:hypothetical protein
MSAFLEDYVRAGKPSSNHDSKGLCRAFVVNSKQNLGASMFGPEEFGMPDNGPSRFDPFPLPADTNVTTDLNMSHTGMQYRGEEDASNASILHTTGNGPLFDNGMLRRSSYPSNTTTSSGRQRSDAGTSAQQTMFACHRQMSRPEQDLAITPHDTVEMSVAAHGVTSNTAFASSRSYSDANGGNGNPFDMRMGTMAPGPSLRTGQADPTAQALAPMPFASDPEPGGQEANLLRDFCLMTQLQCPISHAVEDV